MVAEDYVYDTVEIILEGSVDSDDRTQKMRGEKASRGDVEARLALGIVADLAAAIDYDDVFKARVSSGASGLKSVVDDG